MTAEPAAETIRFSIARDVGNIELLHARFHRRGLPPHWHEEYSIGVSLRGGLAFDYKGAKHAAPNGVISCIAPGEVHNAYSSGEADWEFVGMLIPAAAVREILNSSECGSALPDIPRRIVADRRLARRLTYLHARLMGSGDVLARQSGSLMALADFFRRHTTARFPAVRGAAEPDRVRRVRELIHCRFAETIPLALLAAEAGLSPYHFLRTFRASVGMTPHAYQTQIRVIEAKHRLAGGAAPAEAAAACGFCDQSHMARQFKRAECVTPGGFQGAWLRAGAVKNSITLGAI